MAEWSGWAVSRAFARALVAGLPAVPAGDEQGKPGIDKAAVYSLQHERPSPTRQGRAGHGQGDQPGQDDASGAGGVPPDHRPGQSRRLEKGRESCVQIRPGSGRPRLERQPRQIGPS